MALALTKAAEELVRSALEDKDTIPLELVQDGVTELQNIRAVLEEKIAITSLSNDANLSAFRSEVSQSFQNLVASIDQLKSTINSRGRLQSIHWALNNAHFGSFRFIVISESTRHEMSSSDLIVHTLLSCMEGKSCRISAMSYILIKAPPVDMLNYESNPSTALEFQTRFVSQLRSLTAIEPCVKEESDGGFCVFV